MWKLTVQVCRLPLCPSSLKCPNPKRSSDIEAFAGTPAGDPLETGALSKVFCPTRSLEEPLRIGSIKTNVGHLEGASGVAGVIKTVLMLENKTILPNRNFLNANPRIPLYDWKLKASINQSSSRLDFHMAKS